MTAVQDTKLHQNHPRNNGYFHFSLFFSYEVCPFPWDDHHENPSDAHHDGLHHQDASSFQIKGSAPAWSRILYTISVQCSPPHSSYRSPPRRSERSQCSCQWRLLLSTWVGHTQLSLQSSWTGPGCNPVTASPQTLSQYQSFQKLNLEEVNALDSEKRMLFPVRICTNWGKTVLWHSVCFRQKRGFKCLRDWFTVLCHFLKGGMTLLFN